MQVAQALTGFEHNAICPIGMTKNVPVIIAEAITKLDGDWMWLGGRSGRPKIGLHSFRVHPSD